MRAFAAVLAVLLASCAGGTSPAPSAFSGARLRETPATSRVPMQADAFVESLGVNTHLGFDLSGPRGPRIVQAMRELGLRHVRDGIFPHQSSQTNALERNFFAATGSDMLAIIDCPKPLGYYPGSQTPPAVIEQFDRNVGRAVAQLDGPNEPDLRKVANWAPLTRACVAHDDRALPVPFVAPAMGYPPHASQLGSIASLVNIGGIHRYFSGHNPGTHGFWKATPCGMWMGMKTVICEARINAGPTASLWITETGYTTDGSLGSSEGEGQVDEVTAAKYVVRALFYDSLAGIARSYLYELHDGGTDASNPENGYGLLNFDGTPKPSFRAVRNVVSLLTDRGPAFTPTPLVYGVRGPATIESELFEKRDGTYVLAIWNEVPSWNWNTGKEITVSPVSVTLAFASAPANVAYAALDDSGTLKTLPPAVAGANVTIPVDDRLGFLTFTR